MRSQFGHFVDVKTIEAMQAAFKSADADRNRQLTVAEFQSLVKKNGVLSRKRSEALWAELDVNKNGAPARRVITSPHSAMQPAILSWLDLRTHN